MWLRRFIIRLVYADIVTNIPHSYVKTHRSPVDGMCGWDIPVTELTRLHFNVAELFEQHISAMPVALSCYGNDAAADIRNACYLGGARLRSVVKAVSKKSFNWVARQRLHETRLNSVWADVIIQFLGGTFRKIIKTKKIWNQLFRSRIFSFRLKHGSSNLMRVRRLTSFYPRILFIRYLCCCRSTSIQRDDRRDKGQGVHVHPKTLPGFTETVTLWAMCGVNVISWRGYNRVFLSFFHQQAIFLLRFNSNYWSSVFCS